jgi:hypothetical protein
MRKASDVRLETSPSKTPNWRFVATCIIVLIVATSLPYLFGYLTSPPDKMFMGIVSHTPDIAQYLAWMKGFTTANLIDNHLTPEPNATVFFNLLWWILGKLTTILPLSPMMVIHLYRLFSIVIFSVILYWFIGLFTPDQQQRRGAFLVACFGGGLGWIWVIAKYTFANGELLFPRDLYVVEANTFMSMMDINHFTISAALMILIYGLFALGCERRQWRYPLLASFVALILGWEHAYDLLLIYAIIGAFTFIMFLRDGFSWHLVLYPMVIGLVSGWAALYSLYITRAFPVWKAVLAQFDNAGAWTPDPLHLLILLGLPFIVALVTFFDGLVPLKERSLRNLFVRVWFVVNLFMVYVPLNFQIHYLNGWQVPIAILATGAFFERILPWIRRQSLLERLEQAWSPARLEKILLTSVLLAVVLVNFYTFAWRFVVLARLPHSNFLERDESAALDWLAQNAAPDDVVLSAAEVGQYIPSQVGARAFLAHWAMTKGLYEKQGIVQDFFETDTSDDQRQAIIQEFGVDYVFMGVEERVLGDYNPAEAAYLEPCFTSPQATVYCVRENQLTQTER